MIFILFLLLVFETRADDYPLMYGVMPYGYNNIYQLTTNSPESESTEEESDSSDYVICTCDTCRDLSCEEFCRTCPQNNPRKKYKERTYENVQYLYERSNPLRHNFRRSMALRSDATQPTNKLENVPEKEVLNKIVPKDEIGDENKVISTNNEIQAGFDTFDNSIVKLTYNKAQNDILNVEFLLNDRDKILNEEKYVSTPIRRTKLNINQDVANTQYRNIKMLHS